ncbi:hypothetical protein Kfla_5972 [Kribbella flavida DSM 17836]|uniref:Uncharacterized protein n=1 Tax=Kribbella flavida (strain DSM 17836 / JCM 10339 / NBRC 14399) TaxID=479435 RepID=D2PSS3_KRIFD|nr:hypothetical protein [Kribbella flavida]ADB34975.1 hypothetical protein Kfla_5972 [Kribbella flavida DSM 17836]
MTQTISAPPATWSPPAAPVTQQPSPNQAPRSAPKGAIANWFYGTPGRMRALLILTATLSVLFGLAAAQGFRQSDGALQRAEANTAQLVRVQAIHTSLVAANADATNAFLVGGLEPPAQRQHFVDSLATASRLIAEAATAQPADQTVLGRLNTTLLTYSGQIEQARANNRQGLPIGSQYLKDANATLQNESLPLLDALVSANEDRVSTEFNGVGRGSAWLTVGGLLCLAALVVTMIWLARRTHRYLNVPLAAGAALVLLTMVVGGAALASASSAAKDTRSDAYADALALARARIAAYDAKSNESLTLIARGSGAEFEQAWKDSAARVDEQLAAVGRRAGAATTQWRQYQRAHTAIRQADDAGNWDAAVQQAIGSGQTSANSSFAAFDRTSTTLLAQTSDSTQARLADARGSLPPIGWLGLPIGIAAALLAAWGLSQRLGEYR